MMNAVWHLWQRLWDTPDRGCVTSLTEVVWWCWGMQCDISDNSSLTPGMNISPMATYTVIVNCSATNLTAFPSLPSQTTVLDLSHNALTQVDDVRISWGRKDVKRMSGCQNVKMSRCQDASLHFEIEFKSTQWSFQNNNLLLKVVNISSSHSLFCKTWHFPHLLSGPRSIK